MSLKLNVSFGIWISTNCPRFDNGILDPENIKKLISGLFFVQFFNFVQFLSVCNCEVRDWSEKDLTKTKESDLDDPSHMLVKLD